MVGSVVVVVVVGAAVVVVTGARVVVVTGARVVVVTGARVVVVTGARVVVVVGASVVVVAGGRVVVVVSGCLAAVVDGALAAGGEVVAELSHGPELIDAAIPATLMRARGLVVDVLDRDDRLEVGAATCGEAAAVGAGLALGLATAGAPPTMVVVEADGRGCAFTVPAFAWIEGPETGRAA